MCYDCKHLVVCGGCNGRIILWCTWLKKKFMSDQKECTHYKEGEIYD